MLLLAHSVSNMPSFRDLLNVSVKWREIASLAPLPCDAKTDSYWISRLFTPRKKKKNAYENFRLSVQGPLGCVPKLLSCLCCLLHT